jgi:hypothetical protein
MFEETLYSAGRYVMTNAIWFRKTKQYLIFAISCFAAVTALFYISYICALLNPSFYEKIFTGDDIRDCFETISQMLSINGEPAFSGQSVRNNAISLIEGITRHIKTHDMSFADIIPERESAVSLRSAVTFAEPGTETDLLGKLKIHPFMLGYFLPGSNSIFIKLQTIQTAYTAVKFLIPVLSAAAFLIILISGKPSYYIRITLIISCAVLFSLSFFMYISRNALFAYLFEKAAPGISGVLKPFIKKAAAALFIRSIFVCLVTIPVAITFGIKPVINAFDRHSGTLAVLFAVIIGVVFSLCHNELRTVITGKYRTFAVQKTVDILNWDDEAIHSLVIKLREEGSNEPVSNAKIVIYGADTSNNPLWISAYSDINGDARFILPKGSFNVYSDESTLPNDRISFGTVSIDINKPGSSWYTLHIRNKNEEQ